MMLPLKVLPAFASVSWPLLTSNGPVPLKLPGHVAAPTAASYFSRVPLFTMAIVLPPVIVLAVFMISVPPSICSGLARESEPNEL